MPKMKWFARNIDLLITLFLLSTLFLLPLIFVRNANGIQWNNLFKIWQDYFLLIPLFVINHWLLIPKLVAKKSYFAYLTIVVITISLMSFGYYAYESGNRARNKKNPPPKERVDYRAERQDRPERRPPPPDNRRKPAKSKPAIPPYANLLFLSLMVITVDTGLSFTKHWYKNEEDKLRLQHENAQVRLSMLQHQVNPHFFMNTLNNIYSLIGGDNQRSRAAVMWLSKLMRFLLYENKTGSVMLSKEFEFLENFVNLMRLRYDKNVDIKFETPKNYTDFEIPSLLFISFMENAFKYGVSYQKSSFIHINFDLQEPFLTFKCINSINSKIVQSGKFGGIGLENSKHRLDLLYQDNYELKIENTGEIFIVEIKIPIK